MDDTSGQVVIGLDPSSRKIAIALTVEDDKPVLMAHQLPLHDMPRACHEAYKYVRGVVREYTMQGYEVHFFIEGPVLGRGGAKSTIVQSKTNGAMQAGAVSGGAFVTEVNNQVWKKRIVGNGNAGKPQIRAHVRDSWPFAFNLAEGDQDLLDALCILLFGQETVRAMRLLEAEEQHNEPAT